MSEVGNEKLKELAEALHEIVGIGEDIAKDGLSIDDAMQLVRLAAPGKKIYEIFQDFKALGDEVKDLDWNELGEILAEFND